MFDTQDIIEKYLGSASSYSRKSEPDEKYYFCPECNWKNPRLSVDYGKNMFHCWYCGWGGRSLSQILYKVNADKKDIFTLKDILGEKIKDQQYNTTLSELRNRLKNPEPPEEKKNKYRLYLSDNETIRMLNDKDETEEFTPVWKSNSIFAKICRKYLKVERGLSTFEIKHYRIYFHKDRILFPNFIDDTTINYWVKRSVQYKFYEIPDKDKVGKSDVIFFERLVDFSQPVILSEGIFDAVNIGFNSVPLLGTFANKVLVDKMAENNTPFVYVWLDNDALPTAIKLANYLRSYGFNVGIISEFGYKDPAEIPRNLIENIIKEKTKPLHKFEII